MHASARELRKTARSNLKKRRWWAVLLTMVTVWLGGTSFLIGPDPLNGVSFSPAPSFNFSGYDFGSPDFSGGDAFYYTTAQVQPLSGLPEAMLWLMPLLLFAVLLALFSTAVAFAVIFTGGPIRLGYSRWCLQMHDADAARPFATLFSGFRTFGKGMGLYWWSYLKLFLWQLIGLGAMTVAFVIYLIILIPTLQANEALPFMADEELTRYLLGLIATGGAVITVVTLLASIPAVIARYRYSMAYYLMIENPYLSATDAVRCSIHLMQGHKWRLFCLNLSFIGWRLLDFFTLGLLGLLYLNAYREFAVTAFYRDLVPASPVSQLWSNQPEAPRPAMPEGCGQTE